MVVIRVAKAVNRTDTEVVAIGHGATLACWRYEDGPQIAAVIRELFPAFSSLACSPDGELIVVATSAQTDGTVDTVRIQ
jgi:hypothetical protein